MAMTAPRSAEPQCTGIARYLGWMGDRWTLPVVVALEAGPLRFNRLRRAVSGISQQMLARTLRMLERDGMVGRTGYARVPPQVEYALTPLGHSLARQGFSLGGWVEQNQLEIEARREFDRLNP